MDCTPARSVMATMLKATNTSINVKPESNAELGLVGFAGFVGVESSVRISKVWISEVCGGGGVRFIGVISVVSGVSGVSVFKKGLLCHCPISLKGPSPSVAICTAVLTSELSLLDKLEL